MVKQPSVMPSQLWGEHPEKDHRMQDYSPCTEPQNRSRDEQVCSSVQTWGFAESSIELPGNQSEPISKYGTSAVNMGFL
jgi:hypothetical protein